MTFNVNILNRMGDVGKTYVQGATSANKAIKAAWSHDNRNKKATAPKQDALTDLFSSLISHPGSADTKNDEGKFSIESKEVFAFAKAVKKFTKNKNKKLKAKKQFIDLGSTHIAKYNAIKSAMKTEATAAKKQDKIAQATAKQEKKYPYAKVADRVDEVGKGFFKDAKTAQDPVNNAWDIDNKNPKAKKNKGPKKDAVLDLLFSILKKPDAATQRDNTGKLLPGAQKALEVAQHALKFAQDKKIISETLHQEYQKIINDIASNVESRQIVNINNSNNQNKTPLEKLFDIIDDLPKSILVGITNPNLDPDAVSDQEMNATKETIKAIASAMNLSDAEISDLTKLALLTLRSRPGFGLEEAIEDLFNKITEIANKAGFNLQGI